MLKNKSLIILVVTAIITAVFTSYWLIRPTTNCEGPTYTMAIERYDGELFSSFDSTKARMDTIEHICEYHNVPLFNNIEWFEYYHHRNDTCFHDSFLIVKNGKMKFKRE